MKWHKNESRPYQLEIDIRMSHMWHTNDPFLGQFPIHTWCHSFLYQNESHLIWSDIRMRHVTYELEIDIRMSHVWHTNDLFLGQFPIHMWCDSYLCHNELHYMWCDVQMRHVTYELEIDIKISHVWHTNDLFLFSGHCPIHMWRDSFWCHNESH